MATQNLTPQLRTRLSRMERVVGLFITLATLLFVFGLGYYVYQTAKRKGWFLIKAPYFTFVENASGMKPGDKVKLMGFAVGEITEITAQPPYDSYNVYVAFVVYEPYYGYLWKDSRARVISSDFLGGRTIEVTKGLATNGVPSYIFNEVKELPLAQVRTLVGKGKWLFNDYIEDPLSSNLVVQVRQPVSLEALNRLEALGIRQVGVFDESVVLPRIKGIFNDQLARYKPFTEDNKAGYFLPPNESPALTERLENVVNLVERNIPNFLDLTNKLNQVLTNMAGLAARADAVVAETQPAVTNLNAILAQLSDPNGSLGQWLLPTNLSARMEMVLGSADHTMQTANGTLLALQSNVASLSSNLFPSLDSLAQITSNLNAQVQANQFILGDVSTLVRNTDDMVQGLKRHWLMKGAFAVPSNAVPQNVLEPSRGGSP